MRLAEVVVAGAFLGAVAASAAAHGVHDLRGKLRIRPGLLLVELDEAGAQETAERCLRLLDELHVRGPSGRRLAGTRRSGELGGRCVLEYELDESSLELSLRPRHPHRGPFRGERWILQPWSQGEARGAPLVLTANGRVAALELDR